MEKIARMLIEEEVSKIASSNEKEDTEHEGDRIDMVWYKERSQETGKTEELVEYADWHAKIASIRCYCLITHPNLM